MSSKSQYPPAAGTTKGPKPRDGVIHPPRVLAFPQLETVTLLTLKDHTAYAVYFLLRNLADFDDGSVLVTYAQLMGNLTPPRPERGRRGTPPTYEQIRRVLRDLELVGLVVRDKANNAAQGQLRMVLPYPAGASDAWKKLAAQRQSAQDKPQGKKPRKAS